MPQKSLAKRRREFVNQEVAIKLQGKKVSKRKIRAVFRQAWREAKRKVK